MGNSIKKLGSIIHHWHERAYTLWRIRETGVHFRKALAYYEQVFFLEFRSALIGDNLIVYDIGAASGVFSACLAKLCNVQSVHAFEPIPSAFAELTEHTRQYPQIERHNVAVGAENAESTIWVTVDSRDSSSLLKMLPLHKEEQPYATYEDQPEKIQIVRLDDFVREKQLPLPDVMKIDVQGYETHVLDGGSTVITHAAFVILEMSFLSLYEGGPLFDDVYCQMRNLGFRLVGMTGGLRGVSGRHLQADGIFQNLRYV
jgi:FkbM family methyltransferase